MRAFANCSPSDGRASEFLPRKTDNLSAGTAWPMTQAAHRAGLSALWDGEPIKRVRALNGLTALPGRGAATLGSISQSWQRLDELPKLGRPGKNRPARWDEKLEVAPIVTRPKFSLGVLYASTLLHSFASSTLLDPIPFQETSEAVFGPKALR